MRQYKCKKPYCTFYTHRNIGKEKIKTGRPFPLTSDLVQRNDQHYHNPNELKMDGSPTALMPKNKLFTIPRTKIHKFKTDGF